MKKIGKKCEGTKNKIGDKSAIPKKVQILNVSNIVDKKVQILNVSNIVHKNVVDKNIVKYGPLFWTSMNILSICPNVVHSKSGFADSFLVSKIY